jgi:hypothetical protein
LGIASFPATPTAAAGGAFVAAAAPLRLLIDALPPPTAAVVGGVGLQVMPTPTTMAHLCSLLLGMVVGGGSVAASFGVALLS